MLVDRSGDEPVKAWPVEYLRMFDMTNDSHLFWSRAALEAEGAYETGAGRWRKGAREWLPLYVGRMIHHFDHRASSVVVNPANVHNAAISRETSAEEKRDPAFVPEPQYRVDAAEVRWSSPHDWAFAFRDIARSTDERTAIGTLVPRVAAGNIMPIVGFGNGATVEAALDQAPFAANLSAIVFDFVCRQKIQSTHLNWYLVEQLPFVPPEGYDRRFGAKTAREIVADHVLRLTYTAHDLAAFARDMGHVDESGEVLPPIPWDEAERRHLRARLGALYFHLYGVGEEATLARAATDRERRAARDTAARPDAAARSDPSAP